MRFGLCSWIVNVDLQSNHACPLSLRPAMVQTCSYLRCFQLRASLRQRETETNVVQSLHAATELHVAGWRVARLA